METVKLTAQQRHRAGKGVARRLRNEGKLPAVLYGHGDTETIAIAYKDLITIQRSEAGENTILELVIEGTPPKSANAILREVQIDPVSQMPLHVDLYRVLMDEPIAVTVPLEFVNEPEDRFKAAQVMLTPLLRDIEVECLPRDIPDAITVDLETLEVGDVLRAESLVLPAGVTLLTDPEEPVVTTEAMREAVVEEAAEAAMAAGAAGEAAEAAEADKAAER